MTSKIIFWVSGALTTFCLAHYLQKKTDSNFFAIIEFDGGERSGSRGIMVG